MGCGSSTFATGSVSNSFDSPVLIAWKEAEESIQVKRRKATSVAMPKRSDWKTVRVFVSSTFKDFHSEREILIKHVFPELRIWCELRKIHLVECDLRWGIPKDSTSENTLKLCLGEIDRCYQDNILPFFINMTGDRCGWIPQKEDVPESIVSEYKWVFGLSMTEMEIMHAAYRIDNPNSLFLFRDNSCLKSIPEQYCREFGNLDEENVNPEKVPVLKKMLKSRFPDDRCRKYQCKFERFDDVEGKAYLSGFEQFINIVLGFFKKRINDHYPFVQGTADIYLKQFEAHEAFMKSRTNTLIGRKDILKNIHEYLNSGDNVLLPQLVLGSAGLGKSSIMAKVAESVQKNPENNSQLFFHFVGAAPGSMDVEFMLKRFLKEIGSVSEETMPKNSEQTCQMVCSVLSNHKSPSIIMIVDAVNQLTFQSDHERTFTWVPRKLAPQVKIILSLIDNSKLHKQFLAIDPVPRITSVLPLQFNDRQQIVTDLLGHFNKRLDPQQMDILLAKRSSENPLWLTIACEELRVYGYFEKITKKIELLDDGLNELLIQVLERFEKDYGGQLLIATLCLLETSRNGLLEVELLELLAKPENLAPPSEAYEKEVEDESEKKLDKHLKPNILPAAQWAPVYRALKAFLRPYGGSGEGRLDFYHRSLSKAIRQKHFDEMPGKTDANKNNNANMVNMFWHRKLANYFEKTSIIDRKVEELPYHLIILGESERLASFLVSWDCVDKLYNEYYSSELMRYWREVGTYENMRDRYIEALNNLKNYRPPHKEIVLRYHQVSRVLISGGLYNDAIELLDYAFTIEKSHCGTRDEETATLYEALVQAWDGKIKQHAFYTRSTMPELRTLFGYVQPAIAIRETMSDERSKRRLGWLKCTYSFQLNGWAQMNGDITLTKSKARELAQENAEMAIDIFTEMKDQGSLAEALMTSALVLDTGDKQIKMYEEAVEQCQQIYGNESLLMTRIYQNLAIAHEELGRTYKAFEYFRKGYITCILVFGKNHNNTIRSRDVLEEPLYSTINRELCYPVVGTMDEEFVETRSVEIKNNRANDETSEEDSDVSQQNTFDFHLSTVLNNEAEVSDLLPTACIEEQHDTRFSNQELSHTRGENDNVSVQDNTNSEQNITTMLSQILVEANTNSGMLPQELIEVPGQRFSPTLTEESPENYQTSTVIQDSNLASGDGAGTVVLTGGLHRASGENPIAETSMENVATERLIRDSNRVSGENVIADTSGENVVTEMLIRDSNRASGENIIAETSGENVVAVMSIQDSNRVSEENITAIVNNPSMVEMPDLLSNVTITETSDDDDSDLMNRHAALL